MRFDEKLAKLKAILSEESTFPDAAEDVVEQLNALAGGRLTDEMLAYFRMLGMSRNERVFLGNIQFLGAEWMIKENTDAVPACTVRPFGFFCVASYINGDAICVDLEDVYHPVYHIPVELVNDGDYFCIGYAMNGSYNPDYTDAEEILIQSTSGSGTIYTIKLVAETGKHFIY